MEAGREALLVVLVLRVWLLGALCMLCSLTWGAEDKGLLEFRSSKPAEVT